MEFGASIFFTDYSISPAELAVALEERGFESLWAAEHSHIPVPRRTPRRDPMTRGRPMAPGRRRAGGSNSRASRRRRVIMQIRRRTALSRSITA